VTGPAPGGGAGTGGLRRELADLVAARGLALLDAWLGPVETKLEILAVLAAGRNLLLEGPVGSGKTLLGESIAAALPAIRLAGCHFNCLPGEAACPQCRAGLVASGELELSGTERFVRVQGSPDLFPEDLVGDVDPAAALAHGALDPRAFRPGRLVRAHRKLCFVDEINRLSERLQNLFLELLAERALTIGGYEARFPVDTVVVATMNPDEYVGVGRLSEALRDRFERVRLDYPNPADEVTILLTRTGLDAAADADPVGDTRRLAEAVVGFANQLRAEPEVEAGPSVRATLASFELALAWARLATGGHPRTPGDGVTDWRQAAVAGLRVALRGRLSLRPTHRLAGRPEAYVEDALSALAL
jgi:magnesium chelatase subunit I